MWQYMTGAYRGENVTRYEIAVPHLPRGGTLTIALISDIHAARWFMPPERVARIVAHTNALGADLIAIGGDISAEDNRWQVPVPLEDTARLLAGLRAPLGVFAVPGNHDWWDDAATQPFGDGPPAMVDVFARHGLPVLQNEGRRLDHGGVDLWLAGLDSREAHRRPGRRHVGRHDMGAALAGRPAGALTVLLAHEPDSFAEAPPDVDLTLSGHTHGGQITVFGRPLTAPTDHGYTYGLFREGARHLVVSGGLGCSKGPFRFGVMPEIVLVTLTGAEPG